MISDLFANPFQDPSVAVLIVSGLVGGVLGRLAYVMLRPRDENTAFWTSLVVAAVATVLGLFTLAYGPLLLLSIAALVRFGPRVPRRSRIAAAIVLVAVVVAYVGLPVTDNLTNPITISAVANHFAYDDKDLLTNNDFLVGWMAGARDVQSRWQDYWKNVLTKDFAQLAGRGAGAPGLSPINYYRPVIALSYMLDTFFWGRTQKWHEFAKSGARSELKWERLNPVGFHLTNVLVHALNSLLVFLLVRSLCRRHWVALAAGVLFAVHPIHTESVTWIAGRTDVMATTFYLAAFWCYVRFRNSGSSGALAGGITLALVAALTKEMALPLGVVLLAYELVRFVARRRGAGDLHLPARPVWLRESRPGERLAVACAIAVAGFTVLGAVVYFAVKSGVVVTGAGPVPQEGGPWLDLETGKTIAFFKIFFAFLHAGFWYLGKAIFPLPLNIYPSIPWTAPVVGVLLLLGHLAVAAAPVALLFVWKQGRLLALAVLGFYVSLAPLSCLLEGMRLLRFSEDVDFPVSERFLYLPSFYICLALAWLIAYQLPRWIP
ncbi:MAG: hypothetical protein JXQ29_02005, partial [Planctomycetes bacterium]|nr:hypothetical protein [Planctomycetota bacterium]